MDLRPHDDEPHSRSSTSTGSSAHSSAPTSVQPSSHFDLDGYISRYTGHTKIVRLGFIAQRYPAKRVHCLEQALSLLKITRNTALYRRIYEQSAESDLVNALPPLDAAWADSEDKKAASELEVLENELNANKQNLIRKNIRTGYNAIGALLEARGDFNNALRNYIRTQDYCSGPEQILEMCLHVIEVSLQLGNFAHVLNYVAKAEQTPTVSDKPGTVAVLRAVAGLAQLENRKYKAAARKFLETSWGAQHSLLNGELVAAQDIATYGALCALAEFSRPELKQEVLENSSFKNFLALVPPVQQLLVAFYESRYANCLKALDVLKNDLQLDIHLHDHITALYEKVRNKALVQYFSPYVAVDLNKMAGAFQTSVQDLEKELAKLIADGIIAARIDSHNKRLVAQHTDERSSTFQSTLAMGEDLQSSTRAMLLRVNLVRANMIVKPQKTGAERAQKDRKDRTAGGKGDRRK